MRYLIAKYKIDLNKRCYCEYDTYGEEYSVILDNHDIIVGDENSIGLLKRLDFCDNFKTHLFAKLPRERFKESNLFKNISKQKEDNTIYHLVIDSLGSFDSRFPEVIFIGENLNGADTNNIIDNLKSLEENIFEVGSDEYELIIKNLNQCPSLEILEKLIS